MSEHQRVIEANVQRYLAEIEARNNGTELPPPNSKQFTPLLDHVAGPIEIGVSLGKREPNATASIKDGMATVEPELEDYYLTAWSNQVAERSFANYKASDMTDEARDKKMDEQRYMRINEWSVHLKNWMKRSLNRMQSWQEYEIDLEKIMSECKAEFKINPPQNQGDVDLILEKVGKTKWKALPEGTVEEPAEEDTKIAIEWYKAHKTLDALGIANKFDEIKSKEGIDKAKKVLLAYCRYVAQLRLNYPYTLHKFEGIEIDPDNFDKEKALEVRIYQRLKGSYDGLLGEEIKDTGLNIQTLIAKNRKYADYVRMQLADYTPDEVADKARRAKAAFEANVQKKVA